MILLVLVVQKCLSTVIEPLLRVFPLTAVKSGPAGATRSSGGRHHTQT